MHFSLSFSSWPAFLLSWLLCLLAVSYMYWHTVKTPVCDYWKINKVLFWVFFPFGLKFEPREKNLLFVAFRAKKSASRCRMSCWKSQPSCRRWVSFICARAVFIVDLNNAEQRVNPSALTWSFLSRGWKGSEDVQPVPHRLPDRRRQAEGGRAIGGEAHGQVSWARPRPIGGPAAELRQEDGEINGEGDFFFSPLS